MLRAVGRWPASGHASRVAQIGIVKTRRMPSGKLIHLMHSEAKPIQANTLVNAANTNRGMASFGTLRSSPRVSAKTASPSAAITPATPLANRGGQADSSTFMAGHPRAHPVAVTRRKTMPIPRAFEEANAARAGASPTNAGNLVAGPTGLAQALSMLPGHHTPIFRGLAGRSSFARSWRDLSSQPAS